MQIQFLLGPAGSGKTHRCLADIREELKRSPEGAPLILIAPKQATFQLERQLLSDESLQGYSRLRIFSFERFADFVLRELRRPAPQMVDEEGRLMVLRSLIAKRRGELKLFRASARMAGFAAQLSLALREFQRHLLTPEALLDCAAQVNAAPGLPLKLHDFALLLRDYLEWLKAHDLRDSEGLPGAATQALKTLAMDGPHPLRISGLWLDGFAELSPQELELLAAAVSLCDRATIAFCLDRVPTQNIPWLSTWSAIGRAFEECRNRLAEIPGARIAVEELPRDPKTNRFTGNAILARLEKLWPEAAASSGKPESEPGVDKASVTSQLSTPHSQLRLVACANPEAEAEMAAREILRFVRAGGRFRDASVIVRSLENYHHALQRVFSRFEIPFFLDRRESVAHHPLAELTRAALRLAAFNWPHEDWFAALKTGLAGAGEAEIDRLENEALARGWKQSAWLKPIETPDDPALGERLETLRRNVVPPFLSFVESLANTHNKPNGVELAGALRRLWQTLDVEETLDDWNAAPARDQGTRNTQHALHSTVWDQMSAWLDNVSLAFAAEAVPLREWLPILEAGLANLAVGVIPPALDQVLVGAIDRSRNPDIKLALVLGLNEGVFPAPPQSTPLLTDSDREALEHRGVALGAGARQQIGRERFFGYIAMTRARERLVLSCSAADAEDRALNVSPFLSRVRHLIPGIEMEAAPRLPDWREAEHASELIAPLLVAQASRLCVSEPEPTDERAGAQERGVHAASAHEATDTPQDSLIVAAQDMLKRAEARAPVTTAPNRSGLRDHWRNLCEIPALKCALEQLRHFRVPGVDDSLSPALAEKLYGRILRTSVSRLEQFAACPFKFFIHSGLRAEERKLFELDTREQGSFQHDVLKEFHEQLRGEGKRWRDITPKEARDRVGEIAKALAAEYGDGLFRESDETRFTARVLTASLQDFVETLVGWMHTQYAFDPAQVEWGFGDADAAAWTLDLGGGHQLALRGRIDRVDLWREPGSDEAHCVVLDYKSSEKKLETLSIQHGLQLQLLAYLNVLRRWPGAEKAFGVKRLVPAGVFYVNLRGKFNGADNRRDALKQADDDRKLAYRHSGRFDSRILSRLDLRDARKGDQFNYRRNDDGNLRKGQAEPMATGDFLALLDAVEANLKRMGAEIFSGDVGVSPFRKGTTIACQQCDYQCVCRIDPWTHSFRVLKNQDEAGE